MILVYLITSSVILYPRSRLKSTRRLRYLLVDFSSHLAVKTPSLLALRPYCSVALSRLSAVTPESSAILLFSINVPSILAAFGFLL